MSTSSIICTGHKNLFSENSQGKLVDDWAKTTEAYHSQPMKLKWKKMKLYKLMLTERKKRDSLFIENRDLESVYISPDFSRAVIDLVSQLNSHSF